MTLPRQSIPQLHDYLHDAAERSPDKVALVSGVRRLTFAQLERATNAVAHALQEGGVRRGDRVLVLGDNTPETAMAFWAALKANAVVCMVSAQTRPAKLSYLMQDSEAAAIITDVQLAPAVAQLSPSCPHLRCALLSGEPPAELLAQLPAGRAWSHAVAHEPTDAPPARLNIDLDLAAILYTSGSSGEPKGVMQTHASMRTAAASITSYLENTPDDVIVCFLPLSFDYGLYQMIMAFKLGARLVLERSFAYPATVLEHVVAEGVTGFPGVPTTFAFLGERRDLATYDFSRVRYVTNTAAALPRKHIELIARVFPHARLYSMYGLTECKRVSYLPPEELARRPDSVGVAIPNTELTIVDEQGRAVPHGEVGQIVVRGGTVMRGYWRKPEATARRLRPGPLPGEQVLSTGDYGRMDDEGFLYFVGRMDDIIKSRGEKVAPREVEAVLLDADGVKEAAVIGEPDEVLGEAVVAFVTLEEGAHCDALSLRRHCQARLEPFMVPSLITIVPELPKTTTGKVRKESLHRAAVEPRAGA